MHADRFLPQLLDVGATVTRDYAELREVALFLAQPNVLPPGQALGLYISVSGEWQVGYVPPAQGQTTLPIRYAHTSNSRTGKLL